MDEVRCILLVAPPEFVPDFGVRATVIPEKSALVISTNSSFDRGRFSSQSVCSPSLSIERENKDNFGIKGKLASLRFGEGGPGSVPVPQVLNNIFSDLIFFMRLLLPEASDLWVSGFSDASSPRSCIRDILISSSVVLSSSTPRVPRIWDSVTWSRSSGPNRSSFLELSPLRRPSIRPLPILLPSLRALVGCRSQPSNSYSDLTTLSRLRRMSRQETSLSSYTSTISSVLVMALRAHSGQGCTPKRPLTSPSRPFSVAAEGAFCAKSPSRYFYIH